MKIYKSLMVASAALAMSSCTDLNNPLEDINISVQTSEEVTLENNVITVNRNTPVKFNIAGEPDNITFYSGETGHNYDYRKRTLIDPSQIKSSVMTFDIQNQYLANKAHENLYSLYISETFSGLLKDDFSADCQLLADFTDWQELVPQADLPQKPETKSYSVDFLPYLGKNITLAINYHPQPITDTETGQPKVHFRNFKLTNTLSDGTTTVLNAASFGFTPVNVWASDLSKVEIKEDDLKKNDGYYDGNGALIESALWYGTVTYNIWGMWNLKDAGSTTSYFYVHSTDKGKGLRPSWLVSDYLVINAVTPDTGVSIKNISNRLDGYEYTYSEPGTYKVVFVLNNANYKEEDSRVITMIINVK